MFFSKVTFRNPAALGRILDDEYRIHQFIWDLMPFNPDQKRTFLYRQVGHPIPTIFILSETAPQLDSELLWVESKVFAPVLRVNSRLQFSVRVNPVVAKYTEAKQVGTNSKARSSRHDVVMNEKFLLMKKGENIPSMQEIIDSAISRWLTSRAENNGFVADAGSLVISSYTQRELFKRQSSRSIRLSTVDISGVLTITNSEKFTNCLYGGLGPAKGFGCGLMLIKPCG